MGWRPTRVRSLVALSLLAGATLWGAAAPGQGDDAASLLDRAVNDFLAGRIDASVRGFDRVVALEPSWTPELWQRGIALYYAGRYGDCRTQFEQHRRVNPSDVENPAWHFLCVARADSPARARAALLPVGDDPRRPMREIYEMFQGSRSPDSVLAAVDDPSGEFYAALYAGLYYEAIGDLARARALLARAAAPRYAQTGGYMHRVAALHPLLQGRGRAGAGRSER